MAGVLFVVCVPSAKHEEEINKEQKLINKDQQPMQTSTPAENIAKNNLNHIPVRKQNCFARKDDESVVLIQDELCGNELDVEETPNGKNELRSGSLKPDAKILGAEALKRSWDGFKELVGSAAAAGGVRRVGGLGGCRLLEEEGEGDDEGVQQEEENVPLEKILRELLESMGVENAVWCDAKDGKYYQVIFSIETGVSCEQALQAFADCGIGLRLNSVVSVIPCALHYRGDTRCTENDVKHIPHKSTAWDKFVQSVRARLTVAQVVESVKAEAAWTFDFMLLLIIAAFLAALGLVEDSTVFLVSSMLISPLMGPIIAGTFGTCIHDRGLMRLGVVNEMLGILLTMAIGFLFGLVICMIDDRYGVGEWPTNEMLSKCEIRSLWVGALIAFPSGAAGAIAVLGDNTGSLVGVAISASLLPPAVNAGLVWAMSFSYLLWQDNGTKFNTIVDTQQYSSNQAVELAVMGFISLCLTLVNVICIYVAGILVLKIKEVAPLRSHSARHFWRHDVKIARDYNRTVRGEEARNLARGLLVTGNGSKNGTAAAGTAVTGCKRRQADVNRRYSEAYGFGLEQSRLRLLREHLNQWTWSPCVNEPARPTIQELGSRYESMTGERFAGGRGARSRFIGPLIRTASSIGPAMWSPVNPPPLMATGPIGAPSASGGALDEPALLESIQEMSDHTALGGNNRVSVTSNGGTENYQPMIPEVNKMATGCTRRKFVVTPAKEDPLVGNTGNNNIIGQHSEDVGANIC